MHVEAQLFVQDMIVKFDLINAAVIDLGGRDVNGNIHGFFTQRPVVLDIMAGDGVDIVADASTWEPDRQFDAVICTEVFEHTPRWRRVCDTARKALRDGGVFIATCARDDRPPHSAIDGAWVRDGEYYGNVGSIEMTKCLTEQGWSEFTVQETDGHFGNDDLQLWAVK